MTNRMDAAGHTDAENDRLAQASEMMAHLQSQLDELDRREQILKQQIAIAEEQQRSLKQARLDSDRHAAANRQDLETREQTLLAAQNRLQQQQKEYQLQFDSYENEVKSFHQRQEELKRQCESELHSWREKVQQELNTEREQFESELSQNKQRFEKETKEKQADLNLQYESLQKEKNEHQQTLAAWSDFKATELGKLKIEFTKEVSGQRESLELEKKEFAQQQRLHQRTVEDWEKLKVLEQSELQTQQQQQQKNFDEECVQLRESLHAELAAAENQLNEEKQRFKLEQSQHLEAVSVWEASLRIERQRFDDQLLQEKSAFELESQQLQEEFAKQIQTERKNLDHEFSLKRKELEADFANKFQALEIKLQTFETERNQFETEIAERRSAIDILEKQLADDRLTFEKRVTEFQLRQQRDRDQFDQEMLQAKKTFTEECLQLKLKIEEEGLIAQTLLEDQTLQKQQALVASFTEKELQLSVERDKFNQKLEDWETRKVVLQVELDAELTQQQEEFSLRLHQEQEQFESECQQRNQAAADALASEREILSNERQRLREELSKELEEDKNGLKAAWQELHLARREQERLNEDWSQQRTVERAKIFAEVEEIKKEKLSALDQREKNLQRREIDFQKRNQLHELHLDRVRGELNVQKAETERQRQKQQVWKEQVEQGIRYRLNHMKRFRDLMAQREECLEDEQKVFQEARRTIERELDRRKENFQNDKESWQHQKTETTLRLQKREERLDQEYEMLAESHQRVTLLCEELEDLIQQTSLTSRDFSPQTARHLNGLLGIFGRQKKEADQSIHRLQERLQEIRTEGAELSTWVEDRETAVSVREQNFRENCLALEQREEELAASRDEWNADRFEAEQVIRDLVVQLEIALDQIARIQTTENPQTDAAHSKSAA